VIQTILDGGLVMVPIGLCSLVALAAFFERIWTLRRSRVVPRSFVQSVLKLVRAGQCDEALAYCRKRDLPVARLFETAIELRHMERSEIKERLEEVGRREAAELERVIPVVGTIASVAPLLGLLGTVGGMISTFAVIQAKGLGQIDSMAGGISQALITTFAGLCVGIPAVMGNRYLLARVDMLLLGLEEASVDVLDALGEER
jgi:biopolymer transport protein ExbB